MAPQVRIEPPPCRLLLSQYEFFEVLLCKWDNFHIGSLDERAGQNVSMVILFIYFFKFYLIFKVFINIHNYANQIP